MSETNSYSFGVAIGRTFSLWKPYLYAGTIKEGIKKAREWGYDAVELHHIDSPREANPEKILECCRKNSIKISANSTGPAFYKHQLSLTDNSETIRKKAVARLKEYIDLAAVIGGMVTIGTMRGNIADLEHLEICKKRLAETLKETSGYAAKKNITLLLEVANRYEINYLNRVDEIFYFIRENHLDFLKIHMDTFHMNIEEIDICQAINKYGDLLGYFHVADSNRYYPGGGHIDFISIASALSKIKYNGYIVVECLPLPDFETAALKALDYLKKYFN